MLPHSWSVCVLHPCICTFSVNLVLGGTSAFGFLLKGEGKSTNIPVQSLFLYCVQDLWVFALYSSFTRGVPTRVYPADWSIFYSSFCLLSLQKCRQSQRSIAFMKVGCGGRAEGRIGNAGRTGVRWPSVAFAQYLCCVALFILPIELSFALFGSFPLLPP